MMESTHNFFSWSRQQRNLIMKTGTRSWEKGQEKRGYLMTQPQAQNQSLILPSTAESYVTHRLGKTACYHPCRANGISFFFLFPNSVKGSPLPTGPNALTGLIRCTERLFSPRHIWANQSLQRHFATAHALYVGEIMKHLIGETNIKVQKERSDGRWREMASVCTQPSSTSPFQTEWGFSFSAQSLIYKMVATFQEGHRLLLLIQSNQ